MKLLLILVLLLSACSPKLEETEEISETEIILETENEEVTEETEYDGEYSVLSGRPAPEGNGSRAYGVMIDNQVDARPQAGLSKADIIYEYEVESNLTRYLAIFGSQEVESIGPIRSARPYFIDTLGEYDAMYVRFGGSDQADGEIAGLGIPELNGMTNGTAIWRDDSTGKFAPHNAYSSSEAIRTYMDNAGYQTGQAQGVFSFKEEFTPLEGEGSYEASDISLTYNEYETMSFKFKPQDNAYVRSISGQVQVDEHYKDEIKPSNVIILFMDMGYMENGIHRWMENIGEGEGIYLSGGRAMDIRWSKADRFEKTVLTYGDGSKVILNPGQTWIANFNPAKAWSVD